MDFYWIDKNEKRKADRKAILMLTAMFSAVAGAVFNEITSEKMETQELHETVAINMLAESATKAVFFSSKSDVLSFEGDKQIISVGQAMSTLEKTVRETHEDHWAIAYDSDNKEVARVRCKPRFRQPAACTVFTPFKA